MASQEPPQNYHCTKARIRGVLPYLSMRSVDLSLTLVDTFMHEFNMSETQIQQLNKEKLSYTYNHLYTILRIQVEKFSDLSLFVQTVWKCYEKEGLVDQLKNILKQVDMLNIFLQHQQQETTL